MLETCASMTFSESNVIVPELFSKTAPESLVEFA